MANTPYIYIGVKGNGSYPGYRTVVYKTYGEKTPATPAWIERRTWCEVVKEENLPLLRAYAKLTGITIYGSME